MWSCGLGVSLSQKHCCVHFYEMLQKCCQLVSSFHINQFINFLKAIAFYFYIHTRGHMSRCGFVHMIVVSSSILLELGVKQSGAS